MGRNPGRFGKETAQISFDPIRIVRHRPPQTAGQAADMGVHRQGGDAEGGGQDHVGGLPADPGELNQGGVGVGHPTAMLFFQDAGGGHQMTGLVPVQTQGANEGLHLDGLDGSQGGGVREALEQRGGAAVDRYIGALGGKNHCHQQMEGVLVIQLTAGLGVEFFKKIENLFRSSPPREGGVLESLGKDRGHPGEGRSPSRLWQQGCFEGAFACILAPPPQRRSPMPDTVIVVHGFQRTSWSCRRMEVGLSSQGFRVVNRTYPSLAQDLPALGDWLHRLAEAQVETLAEGESLHVVTHSMGGLLLRQMLTRWHPPPLHRVVTVAPPHHGAELAVHWQKRLRLPWGAFNPLQKLVPEGVSHLESRVPDGVEWGILTGGTGTERGMKPWLTGDNDGKVRVEEARLPGCQDFLVLPFHHTFVMGQARVIEEVGRFLLEGRFDHREEVGGTSATEGPVPSGDRR